MPLVRISLRAGTSPEYRKAIADGVHRAMVESLAVPEDDRFQVLTEHGAIDLIYDPQYLGPAVEQDNHHTSYVEPWTKAGTKTRFLQTGYGVAQGISGTAARRRDDQSGGSSVGELVIWKWRGAVHVNQCSA